MMDGDGDVDMLHQEPSIIKCFSPIQNRKLPPPSTASICSLCPSMDLIVICRGDTLWIHRTVSWQRLATFQQDDVNISSVCWAPDGKSLAVAFSDGTIALHHVEALSSEEDTGQVQTLQLPNVKSLTWAHVGKPHASWILSETELERQVTWKYQSRYLDRASTFLPPSSYLVQEEESVGAAIMTHPSCQTPLSLLCATTRHEKLHLYLHGRYDIATLESLTPVKSVCCTTDLSKLLILQGVSSRLTLYHLPALAEYKFPLQVISSLYCSMTSHLLAIELCMKELTAAWRSSLKPLDTKLDALTRLLKNYDVSKDVCTVLHEYILVGSVEDDPVTSALEQFFSNVQMNDQLVQRLERSLVGAVANVETLARRGLLSPAKSLAYEAGDLQCEPLIDAKSTVDLQRATHLLVLSAEDVVARIVEARFRLRDLVSWLRSIGSQIKTRGTAPGSGQRENAKKRRVPHEVTERMASYLQGGGGVQGDGITESLIGISITEFFSPDRDYMAGTRPGSPKSVDILGPKSIVSKRPTMSSACRKTSEIMNKLFAQPKSFVSRSITQTDFFISPSREEHSDICAIHTRIGGIKDKLSPDSDSEGDFFSPRIVPGDLPPGYCRSWAIIARTSSFQKGQDNSVHLFALPLGWKTNTSINDEMNDEENREVPFYLSCRLVMPETYCVKEIAFYGDDGNSSLSAATDDTGFGKEGRQAVGLLVSCPVTEGETEGFAEELWLVKYDRSPFHCVSLSLEAGDNSLVTLKEEPLNDISVISIKPIEESNIEADYEERILYAKTRRVSLKETQGVSSHILLSGSRGVGGILSTAASHVELDLFDLEEDEEDCDEGSEGEEE